MAISIQPIQKRLNAALCQRNAGIGRAVANIDGVPVRRQRISAREYDVLHIAASLVFGLGPEDPGVSPKQAVLGLLKIDGANSSATIPFAEYVEELLLRVFRNRILAQLAKRFDGEAHLIEILSACFAERQMKVKAGAGLVREGSFEVLRNQLNEFLTAHSSWISHKIIFSSAQAVSCLPCSVCGYFDSVTRGLRKKKTLQLRTETKQQRRNPCSSSGSPYSIERNQLGFPYEAAPGKAPTVRGRGFPAGLLHRWLAGAFQSRP